jgi:hypothetical protein
MRGGQVAFSADCGRSTIFSSELEAGGNSEVGVVLAGIQVAHRAEVRVFGSQVRVSSASVASGSHHEAIGAEVGATTTEPGNGHGTLRFHGGAIEVDAATLTGADAVALSVTRAGTGDASARVLETAYAMRAGPSGEPVRVRGDGEILAPYLWPAGSAPPGPGLRSQAGMDLFIETDCDAGGACSGASTPHLMIYSAACPSRWFDSVTAACRP